MNDVKEFTISVKQLNAENVKERISQTIAKTDLQKVVDNAKYLFIKPKQISPEKKVPWKEVFVSTKREFAVIWSIISHTPMHYALIW